eukprot:TRINITY_DN34679_c0_g1_i1.p2 TRINITY_DN34679_c0_g1~~TRINITY_DN34679_c0_g1_i1.p2  ORF type:complete len:289 (-),score=-101.45 TRINITY_DN34679_c0_g1_i1:1426-2268(-)
MAAMTATTPAVFCVAVAAFHVGTGMSCCASNTASVCTSVPASSTAYCASHSLPSSLRHVTSAVPLPCTHASYSSLSRLHVALPSQLPSPPDTDPDAHHAAPDAVPPAPVSASPASAASHALRRSPKRPAASSCPSSWHAPARATQGRRTAQLPACSISVSAGSTALASPAEGPVHEGAAARVHLPVIATAAGTGLGPHCCRPRPAATSAYGWAPRGTYAPWTAAQCSPPSSCAAGSDTASTGWRRSTRRLPRVSAPDGENTKRSRSLTRARVLAAAGADG